MNTTHIVDCILTTIVNRRTLCDKVYEANIGKSVDVNLSTPDETHYLVDLNVPPFTRTNIPTYVRIYAYTLASCLLLNIAFALDRYEVNDETFTVKIMLVLPLTLLD